jgi:tetratricopeptide (TPR) repeat protein
LKKDLELSKELYEAYPQNVDFKNGLAISYFKNGLAISYSKLGETHTSLGNLEQALKFFEDFSKLFKELYEAYPQNVSFKKWPKPILKTFIYT